jgi:glycosyltransferase involved in cell wall biosynthesis
MNAAAKLRLAFLVESGTDVRLVEGLAERFALTVMARRMVNGVEISQPPQSRFESIVGSAGRLGFARSVGRFLREREFDAVLVQGYGAAALVANRVSQRRGMRCFMLVCSPTEIYYQCRQASSGLKNPALRYRRREALGLWLLARLNARVGQHYIVLSEHLRDVVQRHGAKQVSIIPVYGVDTNVFRPAAESQAELRQQRGLPAAGKLIFFSSRVAPEKDAQTLLEAFRGLRQQDFDIWLLHRSGGYREFAELARAYGVGERVIATDAVHPTRELPLDYQCCDVCVQASRAEGLGFSALEALACGTPVVAAAAGGLQETIVEGETGWSYPPGDAAALAQQIAAALSDPAEARRRAEKGKEMVKDRFEQKKVFDQLEKLIASR